MDMGIVRGVLTAILLVAFVALCVRVYLAGKYGVFDDVASLPLENDDDATRENRDE